MLEALAKWSKVRLWWTLTIGYLVTLEMLSWITSHSPPCILQTDIEGQSQGTQNENCPAFHAMAGIVGGFLDDHEGAITALGTLAIAVFCLAGFWPDKTGCVAVESTKVTP